jgi:hypothetical protein
MNYGGVILFPCPCQNHRDWLGLISRFGRIWELTPVKAKVLKAILFCFTNGGKSLLDKIPGSIKSSPGARSALSCKVQLSLLANKGDIENYSYGEM